MAKLYTTQFDAQQELYQSANCVLQSSTNCGSSFCNVNEYLALIAMYISNRVSISSGALTRPLEIRLMTNLRPSFYSFLLILSGMSPSSGNDSEKPRMSYAQLIAEGLVNAPDGMLTLSEIYNAISARHPYYKMEARNWQNSIRHNLTLNKSFTKVPRMSSSEGRGSYWKLEPGAESIIFKRSARNVNKSNTVNNSANTSLNTSSLNLSGVNLVQTSGGMTEVTTANLVSCEFDFMRGSLSYSQC